VASGLHLGDASRKQESVPGPNIFAGFCLLAVSAVNLHAFNGMVRTSTHGPVRRSQRGANPPVNGRRDDPVLSAPGAVIANEARRAEALAPEGISGLTIEAVQSDLQALGFYRGPVSGKLDPPTREAVRQFQLASHLAVTGYLDGPTLRHLGLG
jgi:hypothetical protein